VTVSSSYKRDLRRRMQRWREFYERTDAGDLMTCVGWDRGCDLEGFLCRNFLDRGAEAMLGEGFIDGLIEGYVAEFRCNAPNLARFDDDCVPTALVYWGIGGIAAAMTGGEPFHDGTTSWLEPNLDWDRIAELRFDPNNKWVQFALHVNQALWRRWDEDFHVLPFLHRSPLDAANGIRGTALFEEMYTDPPAVHRLIDWCVDWQLQLEAFLHDNDDRPFPPGWGTAVWTTWLPDRAIFINGDPVGLISREMALEFEQPTTARLFAGTGGGFYHNHTIGLYQTDLVAKTPGTLIQFFVDDPRQPTAAEALLDMPELRETLLASSLETPIGLGVPVGRLDEVLDVARHGRFLLVLSDADESAGDAAIQELVSKVRGVSNLH